MNTLTAVVYFTLIGLYILSAIGLIYYCYSLISDHQKEVDNFLEDRIKWRMGMGFSREDVIKSIKELDEKLNGKGE